MKNTLKFEWPMIIFKNEWQGKTYYKLGLSQKNQDGSYESGYADISFKKGVEIPDKQKVYLDDCFLKFYKTKDGRTVLKIKVNEFRLIEEEKGEVVENQNITTTNHFEEFGKEINLTDEDLPF